jgi:CSLREA domain-containing protein
MNRRNGFVLLSLLVAAAVPHSVNAVTINVNTFEDEVNTDGDCSLREAIVAANTNTRIDACTTGSSSDGDIITLAPGTYMLRTIDNDNDGPNGLPSITSIISIRVASGGNAVIERPTLDSLAFRIFHVGVAGSLGLTNITIRGGNAGIGEGGGLYNRGRVTVLNNVTVTNNSALLGGGIFNHDNNCGSVDNPATLCGFLILSNRTIVDNNSAENGGGGIYNNRGDLSILDSTIRNNSNSNGGGGGIYHLGTVRGEPARDLGVATLENSTVSGNRSETIRAFDGGGGIFNDGTLTIMNSTISGNSTTGYGGGINNWVRANLNLTNVTITNNTADSDRSGFGEGDGFGEGGGISSLGTNVVQTSIIAGNFDKGDIDGFAPDCFGILNGNDFGEAFQSGGFNLIGNTGARGGHVQPDPANVQPTCRVLNTFPQEMIGSFASPIDARLDTLKDNGGPTETHALLRDSPAIDASGPDPAGMPPTQTDAGNLPCIATDQRRFRRLIDGPDANDAANCDIGAFEFGSIPY